MENERFKEKMGLSQTVGSVEETQLIYDHNMKNNNFTSVLDSPSSTNEATVVTPTRDSRNKRRRHELLQVEEAKKLKHIKENTRLDLKTLWNTFQK